MRLRKTHKRKQNRLFWAWAHAKWPNETFKCKLDVRLFQIHLIWKDYINGSSDIYTRFIGEQ